MPPKRHKNSAVGQSVKKEVPDIGSDSYTNALATIRDFMNPENAVDINPETPLNMNLEAVPCSSLNIKEEPTNNFGDSQPVASIVDVQVFLHFDIVFYTPDIYN
jgi:hypothetical protein